MMPNWKEIWNRRIGEGPLDLFQLIKLNGFDRGSGRIEIDDWRIYTSLVAQKIGIKDGQRVYEVGCGSGAFLYALQEQYSLKIGGLDYAQGLVATAISAMPDGDFQVGEAKELILEPKYDVVISNSVFHYFTFDYATIVLNRMLKKARTAVVVMDIPDIATRSKSEAFRRDLLSQEEYEKKYADLEHTYYSKKWFKVFAEDQGLSCEIFDGCVPNYKQNKFRFGVVFKRQTNQGLSCDS